MNYIYIIKEREFKNANVYKIGRTTQNLHERIKAYPKDSELIIAMQVLDCVKAEGKLKKLFKAKFIHRKDIGMEYFEGDINTMKTIFMNISCPLDIPNDIEAQTKKRKHKISTNIILHIITILLLMLLLSTVLVHLFVKF